jgi:hypothetical protein
VVSPVVLGILFYAVITPFGLLTRLLGRDPLRLRPNPQLATYWRDRTGPSSAMTDPF